MWAYAVYITLFLKGFHIHVCTCTHKNYLKNIYPILLVDVILCSEVSVTFMSWKLWSILMAGSFSVFPVGLTFAIFCSKE